MFNVVSKVKQSDVSNDKFITYQDYLMTKTYN